MFIPLWVIIFSLIFAGGYTTGRWWNTFDDKCDRYILLAGMLPTIIIVIVLITALLGYNPRMLFIGVK